MKLSKKKVALIIIPILCLSFSGASARFHFRGGNTVDIQKIAEKTKKAAEWVKKAKDAAIEYANVAKKFSGTEYGSIVSSINSIINSAENVRNSATSVINISNDWNGYATSQTNDLLASGAVVPMNVIAKEKKIQQEAKIRNEELTADIVNTIQLLANIDVQIANAMKSNPEGWLGQRQKHNTIEALKAQKNAIYLTSEIALKRVEAHQEDEKLSLERLSKDSSYATAIPDVMLADNPGNSKNFGFKKF